MAALRSLVLILTALAVLIGQPRVPMANAAPVAASQPGPMVKQAFDLLMDYFVIPPTSSDVLNGGWDRGLALLEQKGVANHAVPRPAFDGDREGDWRQFVERYGQLVEAARDKLEPALLDRAIVGGMADGMSEAHTVYFTPEEFRRQWDEIRGRDRYAGIGIFLNGDRRVMDVFDGSPAAAAGLRPGDQIIAVDGASIEESTATEATARLRGDPGTSVRLTVRRDGESEPMEFTLVRAQVRTPWVAHRILDDRIGYLQLRIFPVASLLGDFRRAMARLEAANVRALVIDVRWNVGGSVESGTEIVGRFIKDGPLFQRIERHGGPKTVTAFGDYWNRDIPIAVLVNGYSASMSEVLASAVQENGVGRVLGTRTAGAVAGAAPYPLADGSGLFVTEWIIKSGKGRALNGVGVEPDQVVEFDPNLLRGGRDTQLEAALDYLRAEMAARPAATIRHRPLRPAA